MKKSKRRILSAVLVFVMAAAMCAFFAACSCGGETPEPEAPTVSSIALNTSGVTTEFDFGATFSAAGLKVTATMSDGTSQDVPLADCRINPPNMQQPGEQTVVVTHTASRKTASYKVTVGNRPIDETPLLTITGENETSAYRVEAEMINMEITEAVSTAEDKSFVKSFDEDGVASAKGALANFGVQGNFFAFAFTSDKEYSGVTMSIAVANVGSGVTPIQSNLTVQLNEADVGIKGGIAGAGAGEYKWREIFVQNLSLKKGQNTVFFTVGGANSLLIDYVDFYVGKTPDIPENKSFVDITEATTYVQEAETDLDLFDFVPQAGFNAPSIENSILASGGRSIGGVGANSTFTVGIRSQEKATVRVIARLAKFEGGAVSQYASFLFDNESVDLGEKSLSAGYGGSNETKFYNWNDVVVGEFNIDTDKTYDLVFNTPSGAINIDALKFAVLTYGEFATDEEKAVPTPNAYISEAGNTLIEAESLDASTWKNTDGASYGEVNSFSSNNKSVGHLAAGSVVNVNVKLSDKATVLVSGYMAKKEADYDLAANMTATFDNENITFPEVTFGPAEGNEWFNWKKVDLGRYDLEAGFHTLDLTVSEGAASPNIDCFEFTTISYGEFTDEEVAGIKITSDPDKTVYATGDTFDKTGMIVKLVGADGTEFCDITDFVKVPAAPLAESDTKVTVSYGDWTADVTVRVSIVLNRIEATAPTKAEYTEGDRFDPAGMVVTAFYSDGTSKDITSEIAYDKLVKREGVTVSYSGKTVAAPITVTELVHEVNITENKTYTVEAENINRDGVVTRDDFKQVHGLWDGEVKIVSNDTATGGKLIEGFGPTTTFTLKIKTGGAAKIAFGARMAQGTTVDATAGFTFGDQALTASSETDTFAAAGPANWYPWLDIDLGSVTVDAAGEYEFVCSIKANCAIDSFTFTVTDYAV